MRGVSGQSGFTLIEIMVVVFILGLLAALVVPNVVSKTDKARVAKAKADIKAIEQAAGMFKLDYGHYPTTAQGIEALVSPPPGGRNVDPEGYLPKVPLDPWQHEYAYVSDGRRIVIKSFGADGVEGGDGYNGDIDNHNID